MTETTNHNAMDKSILNSAVSMMPPPARRLRSSQRITANDNITVLSNTSTTGQGFAAGNASAFSSSTGPIRAKPSRVKGESSLKRKEQNRVAQRAFRKRQKSYFHDLEREVGEKSERIQVIWKSNAYLVDVMQKLQQENIELKKGKAPNMNISMDGSFNFIPRPSSPNTTGSATVNIDSPTLTETLLSTNKGKGRSVDPLESDDELVSVNDLVPKPAGYGNMPRNGKGKSDSGISEFSSPLDQYNAFPLAQQSSQFQPYAQQPSQFLPYAQAQEQEQQERNYFRPSSTPLSMSTSISPTDQSDFRRSSEMSYHSSEGSRGSGSMVDSIVGLDSPGHSHSNQDRSSSSGSMKGACNYDTLISDLQKIHSEQEEVRNRVANVPGIVIRDFIPDVPQRSTGDIQGQQRQRDETKTMARRYSEALRKHHAGPLFGQTQQQPTQTDLKPNASIQQGNTFTWNPSSNVTRQSGSGNLAWDSGKRAKDVSALQQQAQMESFQHVNQMDQQMHSQRQQPQGQVQLWVPGAPMGNLPNVRNGWIPEGLKSDSNGGMMPFTEVLTPLDGGLGLGVQTDYPWPTYPAHWDFREKEQVALEDQNLTAFGHMGNYFVDSPSASLFAGVI